MQARHITFRPIVGVLLLASGILLRWQSPFEPGLTRAFQIDITLFGAVLVVASGLSIRKNHPDLASIDSWSFDSLMVLVQRACPPPVAHIVQLELAVWGSLWRLVRSRGGNRHHELTYHRHSSVAGLVLLTVVTAPAEILLFELLIPWSWMRLLLLGMAIYGAFWSIGMVAAPRAFPHELHSSGLVLRSGATIRWVVPRTAIAAIEHASQTHPLKRQRTAAFFEDDRASLAVDGKTNIRITLRHELPLNGECSVSEICCYVDEPDKLVAHCG